MIVFALRAALLARCLVSLVFAWHLHGARLASAPELADIFRTFVMVDGVLALAVAVLVLEARWHKALAALAAGDGLIRLAAYAALRFGPGIPYFAVTLVLYAGLLAAMGFFFGVLELVEANRLRRLARSNPLVVVLCLGGLATIALAATQFLMEPSPAHYRLVLIAGAVLESLVLFAVAAVAS
jgi:hypothetical protein